ncbi:MAG TPA: DUF1937 family protein [Pyrinomonadaceae bacterium]|nr:DUF1937 family protein [Pyrinomonadaceae bacterium]
MIIAVAGKYSAETEAERQANFDAMNDAAARLLEIGHTPLIGVSAALPIVGRAKVDDKYEAIMQISMAVISACDAVLVISNSTGANRERDFFIANGRPVYNSIDEIPQNL